MNATDINKRPGDTRVVVAMSGGVDSSVAAAVLCEQGYEVVGITLRLYDSGQAASRTGTCCAGQDIYDARRVADRLGIPHYVLDYEKAFRTKVISAFADSYASGETPVPCVLCNERIKFADLLDTTLELGADALVTGHYVRRIEADDGPHLLRGRDWQRDQSYFLFATTRRQLDLLRFPLGGLTKDETRDIARRHGMTVAEKKDSQDICFVPSGRYTDLLARLRPDAGGPGDIVHADGRVLGRHDGIHRYTVGQRRGLGIAAPEPLYVLRVEPETARVIVGPRDALQQTHVILRDANWLDTTPLSAAGTRVDVKLRSTMPLVPASVSRPNDGRVIVSLDAPQPSVAPGQACVFYRGERVLGGGWIVASDADTFADAGVA